MSNYKKIRETVSYDTDDAVDVRLVEIGGHEYVIACTQSLHGSGISVMHHVGCKACNKADS